MEPDSIAILQAAARGLVEAMKAKGYDDPSASLVIGIVGMPCFILYHERGKSTMAWGATLEELSANAMDKIAALEQQPTPAALAATLGIVEVEPGLWREAA